MAGLMAGPPKPIPMTASVGRGLGPAWARVSSRRAASLATSHRRTFELVAAETALGSEVITRDVPNAAEAKLEHLDDRGLARVGSRVRAGDLLIGRASPQTTPRSPEEKLLRAIFGEAAGELRDSSLRMPPWLEGEIVEAELAGGGARARVVVAWERPLEVGDLIEIGGRRATVYEIAELERDVEIDGVDASGPIEVIEHARDVIEARSIGPYSLVTQQPLRGRENFGGQAITAGQRAALAGAGAEWLLAELMTVKSDAVSARVRCYESIIKSENPELYPPPPAAPGGGDDLFNFFAAEPRPTTESLAVTVAHLHALGLEVDGDPIPARLSIADAQAIRARSRGAVRKPETINYKTHRPEADGLFCQKIFGPIADYECACGKYKRMKHRGVVCEKCGVEVIGSKVRRERFGHIELVSPVPHPLLDGHVLEALPVLPPDLRPLVPLEGGRFATSDLNDLYRRVINRNNRLARLLELGGPEALLESEREKLEQAVAALFHNRGEAVTGPDERPLRSLIEVLGDNAARIVDKAVDYSAAAPLVVAPGAGSRACRLPRVIARELFRPWVYGALERQGYVATIRSAKAAVEKRTAAAEAALESEAAGTPVLLMLGDRIVAREIEIWDHPAAGVDARTAGLLGPGVVQVHIPLTQEARAECRSLPDVPDGRPAEPSGWLGAIIAGDDPFAALREAVRSGASDERLDPAVRLACGAAPSSR